jgi:hypothetical protein
MFYTPPPPMFGHFSPEVLHAFADAHNLSTENQDFSEGVFNFKMCQKPNGQRYGVSANEKCKPPSKEVKAAAAKPKKEEKKKEKMCNQYRPWAPLGMQNAIVPCRELGL